MHTPSHTKVCKFFNFQLTFSQLILPLILEPAKVRIPLNTTGWKDWAWRCATQDGGSLAGCCQGKFSPGTCVYKGDRFKNTSILEVRTYYKPTETFQYTHFSSCHPPGVSKGFIKGEALRLLWTNSSETTFQTTPTRERLFRRSG